MITEDDGELLLRLMQQEIDRSKQTIENGAEVINHFIGGNGQKMLYLLAPWDSASYRINIRKAVKQIFLREGVTYYCEVAEAWLGHDNVIPPSYDPERQEVLFVAGATASGERHLRVCPIITLEGGQRTLGEIDPDYGALDGDSFTMLEPAQPIILN